MRPTGEGTATRLHNIPWIGKALSRYEGIQKIFSKIFHGPGKNYPFCIITISNRLDALTMDIWGNLQRQNTTSCGSFLPLPGNF